LTPDLRGLGDTPKPVAGYEKTLATEAMGRA
jgi:hypothetical protein